MMGSLPTACRGELCRNDAAGVRCLFLNQRQRLPQPGHEAEHGRVLAREAVQVVDDGRGVFAAAGLLESDGGTVVPLDRLLPVGADADAVLVEPAEAVGRFRYAARGSFFVPLGGLERIRRDAAPVGIEGAERILRLGVVALGGAGVELERFGFIALRAGGGGVKPAERVQRAGVVGLRQRREVLDGRAVIVPRQRLDPEAVNIARRAVAAA